jgi:hypothetical protein
MAPDGALTTVSVGGASEPVWSRDGRELFYRGVNGLRVDLIAATMQLGPEPRVLKRTRLFDATAYDLSAQHANYDVSPDGKSFVAVRRSRASYIVVIQNLPAMVKRLERGKPR